MKSGESAIREGIVLRRSRLLLVLACCLGAAVPLSSYAQPASTPAPPISPDDPLVAELRINAERIRRCNEKARVLWDGLTVQEQESVRSALRKPADVLAVVGLLRLGRKAEAEAQVKILYTVDDRLAIVITSLIGYANGIE